MIYVDNAATTQMSPTAISAMLPYFNGLYANPSSLHTAGQLAAEALATARAGVAECLGCLPTEVYFTSGGSEADNQALFSVAALGAKKGKKHLISSNIEHHAILHTLQALQKQGFEITLLPADEQGLITPEQVRRALRPDTALVSIMYANNEIGAIQPIREIGALCRQAKVLFHTDVVQAAGHLPINVQLDNIDMLSLSAHKFHGPKGVGVLYAKQGLALSSLINGGPQERGRRAGTENLPAIMGLAAALREACQQMPAQTAKVQALRNLLIAGLSPIPHSCLNGSPSRRLPGNVSFCFEGVEGEALLLLLYNKGICASSGSACTSGALEPSHVLLAIGRPPEIAHGSLRLSLSAANTQAEIDYIIQEVGRAVAYLRSMSPYWQDLEKGSREHVI